MADDPVVLALRAAIARADSAALRSALGDHLSRLGRLTEALREYEGALALEPAQAAALDGAARTAEQLSDPRAPALRLAADALRQAPIPAASPTASPAPAPVPPEDALPASAAQVRGPGLRVVASDGALVEELAAPALTFADVGGMDEIKARLTRSFLLPLKSPELYAKYGKRIGGGLLLYGPPGCGKTFLARALAGEIGARFVAVGLSEILDMWFGESEKRLHELFELARRRAPTVVFFDEVDAVGQKRSQLKGAAGRTLVNQLLTELDGFAQRNEGVFCLGATNHPWDLDPALRRPGRFDRLVFVPPPDLAARRAILALKLADRPVAAGLDLARLAKESDGYSGADLQALVDSATELAIERSVEEGGAEIPIDPGMLRRAFQDVRPSTRPWFDGARNYALYANEGGVYDDLLEYLKRLRLA